MDQGLCPQVQLIAQYIFRAMQLETEHHDHHDRLKSAKSKHPTTYLSPNRYFVHPKQLVAFGKSPCSRMEFELLLSAKYILGFYSLGTFEALGAYWFLPRLLPFL